MELGDRHLKVVRASIGMTQAAGLDMGSQRDVDVRQDYIAGFGEQPCLAVVEHGDPGGAFGQ